LQDVEMNRPGMKGFRSPAVKKQRAAEKRVSRFVPPLIQSLLSDLIFNRQRKNGSENRTTKRMAMPVLPNQQQEKSRIAPSERQKMMQSQLPKFSPRSVRQLPRK
jgi:hypothetical protein